jgi:hypothetical protein
MTGPSRPSLSTAQRRALLESDPGTGRVDARQQTCAALVGMGLAVRYGRVGDHYLTAEGRRLRAELAAQPPAQPEGGRRGGEAPEGEGPSRPAREAVPSFAADDGNRPHTGRDPGRAAQVAAAWAGLVEIRRVLQDGDTSRPAPWERERFTHAVSLALEAAGRPPSALDAASRRAEGYSVTAAAQPGLAEVGWHGVPDGLPSCQDVLERCGWQCTLHTDRTGRRFLLASPRRA